MASNSGLMFNAASASEVLGSVTAFAVELEKIIAAADEGGSFNAVQMEQLTLLFGNLAGVVIEAVHAAAGKQLTADSVLSLMPQTTALKDPLT